MVVFVVATGDPSDFSPGAFSTAAWNLKFLPTGTEVRWFDDAQLEASMKALSDKLETEAGVAGVYCAFRPSERISGARPCSGTSAAPI